MFLYLYIQNWNSQQVRPNLHLLHCDANSSCLSNCQDFLLHFKDVKLKLWRILSDFVLFQDAFSQLFLGWRLGLAQGFSSMQMMNRYHMLVTEANWKHSKDVWFQVV